jgi:hypothetical protein
LDNTIGKWAESRVWQSEGVEGEEHKRRDKKRMREETGEAEREERT